MVDANNVKIAHSLRLMT